MTPEPLASKLVEQLELTKEMRVLEPSFGSGNFLIPLIRRFMTLHSGSKSERLHKALTENVFGVELDREMYEVAIGRILDEFGEKPEDANIVNADFFRVEYFDGFFDVVVGNPPFGGTFDPAIEDSLDRRFGRWNGHKLKKETYSFFIAKSLDVLATDGELVFITSDTFLTIRTMSGLRQKLLDLCAVSVETLPSFSDETTQPTLVLRASRTGRAESVEINQKSITRSAIESTGNFSWRIENQWERFFTGPTLGEYVVATSGMTVGKNELFVREIVGGNKIYEPYKFEFFNDPITLSRELERARLNKLSPKTLTKVAEQETAGETRRNVRIVERPEGPKEISLPNNDYRFYNKSQSGVVYRQVTSAIYWKDDGDAVLTFKKNGNWYLHGVGGRPFFGREGLTWQLVSSKLNMRFLPPGFILDSGAPCAFLREGIDEDELFFILAWTLTDLATEILKTVINHTRNIQSKDLERLPYPFWVNAKNKREATKKMKSLVESALNGTTYIRSSPELRVFDSLFTWT
jgi:tRNA1(Val) A37 N6-methylase TrmN6